MPQSLAQVYVHVVFSTKNRHPWLSNVSVREQTHAYLGGVCRNMGSDALTVGGTADHVHLLCLLSRNHAIKELLAEMKRESSKWLKNLGPRNLCDFTWQVGYGAFSISPSHVDKVREYIAGQDEHHRRHTFQEEYRKLLKTYGIEYDERYVWD